jgi:hypothetical protein
VLEGVVAVVVAEVMAEVVPGLIEAERREVEAGEHGCEVVEQWIYLRRRIL